MNVLAVTPEASISRQPLPFKGAPIVYFSLHFTHCNSPQYRRFEVCQLSSYLQTVQDSFNIIYICLFYEDIPAQSDFPFDPLLLVYEGGLPGGYDIGKILPRHHLCSSGTPCLPSQDSNHAGMHIHHIITFTLHLDDQNPQMPYSKKLPKCHGINN